jgi:hypothetical protein
LDNTGEIEITNCEFVVAKRGPNYYYFSDLSDNEITIQNSLSNVSKKASYVAAVKFKRTLYPGSSCADQNVWKISDTNVTLACKSQIRL